MNQAELQKLVEEISLRYFHAPFKHEVKINNRMTTTGGRYFLKDHHIDINGHFLDKKYYADLVGIIKHELTHYHLHLAGRGYQHRNRDFKNLLAAVGGSRYTPDIGLRRRQNRNYIYECKNCHFQYPRVRKVNTKKYRCGKCGRRLTLIRKNK
ncbi:SprT family protein [Lactobacillus johnsonii]|uniref:SprT family protein n=2 Tax=Lactobacillus johnsonii TaxID=33959 RepID=A0A9X7XUK9_LACJH|nr:SprT family protein [Lactobacillus johnsonii]AHA97815.1 zinc-metalloprotease [Lactobacillus johnsonii N6.2]QIA88055.1 SprT family protein [Lactobacillus johnsonii]TGY28459.1 SprT family protein [Lactobacillus johnsonii]